MMRAFFLGGLTALIAALAAQFAVAGTSVLNHRHEKINFIESKPRLDATLGWTQSPDTLQAMLYASLAVLEDAGYPLGANEHGLHRDGSRYLLRDQDTLVACEKARLGRASWPSYRCEIHLKAPTLEWSASLFSAQTLLFKGMSLLYERRLDSIPAPQFQEAYNVQSLRIADPLSSSTIICEKRYSPQHPERIFHRCAVRLVP